MTTIAMVSCVKTKRSLPCAAKDLYTSALFKKSRAFAERHADRWFILSAKYGLVEPESVIEPYEQTLKGIRAVVRRQWAERTYRQLQETGLLVAGTNFLWLAGMDYQRDLARLLNQYEQHDPLRGLQFFKRIAWLKESLASPTVT